MKRTRRAISLFFVTVFALMMTFLFGCGGKVEGTYKFKSLSYEQGGVSINVQVGEEFMGYITLTEDFMVVTLNEDGTASIAMNAGGDAESATGTWTDKGNDEIELTFEGDAQVCACDGDTLVFEMDGVKLTLEK